mgnify:CR=1 FL=1|tara:strand:- start:322 stop:1080 length:759 start_codon:yes stop_codon:yes gene_type:complete
MLLGKLFNTCIVLVVWFFVAGPLSKIISMSVNDALWTDRTAVDESAAFMGGLVGSGVYAILLVGGFWFLKKTWFPKKSENVASPNDTKKGNDTSSNNSLMQLLAKNVLFIIATCWLIYIWATGDNTYLVIAIALFLVTGFLLSRHGRGGKKQKVQKKDVQPKVEAEERFSQTNSEHQPQVEDNYQTIEEPSVTFGLYEFERHITDLKLGAWFGIIVSGAALFLNEPMSNAVNLLLFGLIALSVNDMNKAKPL